MTCLALEFLNLELKIMGNILGEKQQILTVLIERRPAMKLCRVCVVLFFVCVVFFVCMCVFFSL